MRWQRRPDGVPMVMDRAYEGDQTRQLVLQLGFEPVVPPNPNRLHPWTYDRGLYRRRNEVERLFRRLKGFRRIFSRFEKLDIMFTAFIHFALIIDMVCVNTPYRAVRRKLNLRTWARIKVLSELGMAAGIIMASDGLSGSMLFTASQLGASTP